MWSRVVNVPKSQSVSPWGEDEGLRSPPKEVPDLYHRDAALETEDGRPGVHSYVQAYVNARPFYTYLVPPPWGEGLGPRENPTYVNRAKSLHLGAIRGLLPQNPAKEEFVFLSRKPDGTPLLKLQAHKFGENFPWCGFFLRAIYKYQARKERQMEQQPLRNELQILLAKRLFMKEILIECE